MHKQNVVRCLKYKNCCIFFYFEHLGAVSVFGDAVLSEDHGGCDGYEDGALFVEQQFAHRSVGCELRIRFVLLVQVNYATCVSHMIAR